MRAWVLERAQVRGGLIATLVGAPQALAAPLGLGLLGLLSVVIGIRLAEGRMMSTAAVAFLPLFVVVFGALAASKRSALVFIALALNLAGLPRVSEPLPLPGNVAIWATDLLVLLALGSWFVARIAPRPGQEVRWPQTPLLGWRLALLAVCLAPGVVLGHERYGASLVGQPLRLVLYAGIAAALTDITPRTAYKWLVVVFYTGAVWESMLAAYYLATGQSQTESYVLSTGGTRVLALSVAMYLAGSLFLALLNLEVDRRRRVLHLAVAGLAAFGIAVSYGRTTYAAVGIVLPLLFLGFRRLRASLAILLPIAVPALVLFALLLPRAAPEVAPTLQQRLDPNIQADRTVKWRSRAFEITLSGVSAEPLTGVGFGRVSSFSLDRATYQIEGDPHNSFIYLLSGGGALALGAFVLLLLTYLYDSWRRFRRSSGHERALIAWAVATWWVFVLNALTGPILTDPTLVLTLWVLMLLPALVRAPERPEQSRLRQ